MNDEMSAPSEAFVVSFAAAAVPVAPPTKATPPSTANPTSRQAPATPRFINGDSVRACIKTTAPFVIVHAFDESIYGLEIVHALR
jgi:hypothetical protein